MSDFRCPRYWWDGSQWRCQNLPNDYLSSYDFDTYCTNKNRCLECPYMDSEVREKVATYKKEVDERVEEHVEEQRREYEAEQRNKENDYSYRENNNTSSTTTYSSSGSSDAGCLGAIFALLGIIWFAILKVLSFIAKYWYIIIFAFSWFGWGLFFLFAFLALPLAGIIGICCVLLYTPYFCVIFQQQKNKRLSWLFVFKYSFIWFLKGPFAYSDIFDFVDESVKMPTKFGQKLLEKYMDFFANKKHTDN